MSETTYLTEAEIRRLTSRTQGAAQMRALAEMGFVAKRGRNGDVLVLRAHHDRVMGLNDPVARKKVEPNWSMVRGATEKKAG